MDIKDSRIDLLLEEIENVRRRKLVNVSNVDDIIYIDPNDYIKRLKSHNNHLIFGRRGSGKTTLMLAAINQNKDDISIIQDSQILRNMTQENIVITVLLRILQSIIDHLCVDLESIQTKYGKEYKGVSGFFSFITRKRTPLIREKYLYINNFIVAINHVAKELNVLLKQDSILTYKMINISTTKRKDVHKRKTERTAKIGLGYSGDISGSFNLANASINSIGEITSNLVVSSEKEVTTESSTQIEHEELKKISKLQLLDDLKQPIITLINEFYKTYLKFIALYLDDFYLIEIESQPYILQYLHDIYKNCVCSCFCFKVCSLPFRLRLNRDNEVNFSYKDDYSPIKLDNNLSELNNRKDYLLRILCNVKPSLGLGISDIESVFNYDEVLLYSVIATGGVPRDFLVMFAELIKIVRADNSEKINKEHVYSVVSDLKEDKEYNIEYDSDISPDLIRNAIQRINDEIIEGLKTNVFLYPSRLAQKDEALLKNLVNLRYLHVIKDSTSSRHRNKEEFVAYLVDMIFYAVNKRMKQGFNFRHFWQKDSGSRLKELDSAPIWSFSAEEVSERAVRT